MILDVDLASRGLGVLYPEDFGLRIATRGRNMFADRSGTSVFLELPKWTKVSQRINPPGF